ncbi:MAG: methyltransferase domain-containing protein [Nitrospirae bacterium]|nr:methyltransferase domain-containing protein [Nitrospirota bacterium]MBI5694952.1 methyltransferase domain-containing protein [Nitrospirota bacterium]
MNPLQWVAAAWRRRVTPPDAQGEYTTGWLPRLVRDEVARRLAGKTGTLLDAGCGEGLLFGGVCRAAAGLDIVGIDPWEAILRRSTKRIEDNGYGRVRLARADAMALPFRDGTFDYVACANVALNLPDKAAIAAMLAEAVRVARPGGYVFVDFRNRLNPLIRVGYMLAPLHDPELKVLVNSYRPDEVAGMFPAGSLSGLSLTGLGMGLGMLSPVIFAEAVKR